MRVLNFVEYGGGGRGGSNLIALVLISSISSVCLVEAGGYLVGIYDGFCSITIIVESSMDSLDE